LLGETEKSHKKLGRLYSAQRTISDTLQEAILISPQKIEGISFGHIYHSATEATKIGGDFYDIFEMEHDKVGIMVGDVSGKGLEAAAVTSLVKNTVKAYSYEETSPALILKKADRVLRKGIDTSCFITLFLGILDTKTGNLIYCSGGHPPAIIKRANSDISLLATSSGPIGILPEPEFIDERQTLKRGDILVLYTDGITEARRGRAFFGEEKLVNLLTRLKEPSVKKLPRLIFNEVIDYTEGTLQNDVVLLTVALK